MVILENSSEFMNNIKCIAELFLQSMRQSMTMQLLAQVRSNEFDKEIHDRLEKEKALLEEKSKNDLQTQASAKDKEISELTTQLEQLKQTLALENQRLLSQKEQEIAELKVQLENLTSVKDLELTQALTEKDKELSDLSAQIEQLKQSFTLENQQALSKKETEITELKAQLENLSSVKKS